MNNELLLILKELATRSKKNAWWQPWQFHEQTGADDAEFIAAFSPEIVLQLIEALENGQK